MAEAVEAAAVPATKKKSKGKKILLAFIILFFVLCAGGAAAFFALDYFGGKGLENTRLPVMEMRTDGESEDGQAEYELLDTKTVKYNGKIYTFNENIKNILLIGINAVAADESIGDRVQHEADVIVLCSIDEKDKKVRLINISRETMTDIQMYTEKGEYVGMQKQQIALAYSYLDGAEKSAQNTVQAVSDLFYGIPVHAYCAVYLNAIPYINDAVGGVDVVVTQDMQHINSEFYKGNTVHLNGELVTKYLKSRSSLADPSNDARMERHKSYIKSFIPTAIEETKKDIFLPLKLYNILNDYIITDISPDKIVYLTRQALRMNIDFNMITLPGENVKGALFMEKHLDERAFYELILKNFYTAEAQ